MHPTRLTTSLARLLAKARSVPALYRSRAACVGAAALLLSSGAAWAQTQLLNVSYDPTARTPPRSVAGVRRRMEGEDGRDGRDPRVARRLGQAGPLRDRRARRRCGDARARGRHRRDRARHQEDPGGLAEAAAATTPRPTPRRSCSWSARAIRRAFKRLGRPRQARRPGHHAQSRRPPAGARWNYLAAWGYALDKAKDEAKARGVRGGDLQATCPCSTPAPAARP